MRSAAALATPSSSTSAPALARALERLALVAVVAHAAFVSISVAGMQIALGIAAGSLVLLRLLGRRVWVRSALDLPCFALCAAAVISIPIAALAGSPPVGWHEATLWRSLLAGPVLLSALGLAERGGEEPGGARRWAMAALLAWALASFIPSAIAWPQYWTGFDPLHALGLRGGAVHAAAPKYAGHYAAVGFFRWYQRLAHNLTPPLCVAAAVALHGGVPRRARALLAAAALAAAAAVVLTLSRAAWASLAGAALLVALLLGRGRRVTVPLVLAASAGLALLPAVRARLVHFANGDRQDIWRVCRAMVVDRPLTGFGWGNLPRRSIAYWDRVAPWGEVRAWCHDSFFSAWVEGGPLLFAALLLFWVLLARAAWRWRAGDALARGAAAGALAAIAATFANSLTHDLLYSSEATYGFGFALAVAAALASAAARPRPGDPAAAGSGA